MVGGLVHVVPIVTGIPVVFRGVSVVHLVVHIRSPHLIISMKTKESARKLIDVCVGIPRREVTLQMRF